MRTRARVGYRVRGVGLPGMRLDMALVGSEMMVTPCLCNHTDSLCHTDYFIHFGLGCLVSISFPFSFFFLCLACDCACGFVQYINRERAAQPARLGGFYVGLIRGLICGMLNFFYSCIPSMWVVRVIGILYFFF